MSLAAKLVLGTLGVILAYGILSGDGKSQPSGSGNSSVDLDERLKRNHSGGGGYVYDAPSAPNGGLYGTDHCVGPCY